MLPNVKKDLHTLKSDFDENGVNRITPKLLRDLLVSVYSSRNPRKILDSQDLDENDDLLIVEMDESGNYLRLPARFENDDSGTPFVNQHYTIANIGVFSVTIVTQPTDILHDKSQSLVLSVGEIVEIVATPEYWFFYSGGTTTPSGGIIGFPVRMETDVDDGIGVIDTFLEGNTRAVKWTVSVQSPTLTRTSEILVNVKKSGELDLCESFILGDDIVIDFQVIRQLDSLQLIVDNQSGEPLNIIVLRVILA